MIALVVLATLRLCAFEILQSQQNQGGIQDGNKPRCSFVINGGAKYTRDRSVTLMFHPAGGGSEIVEMSLSGDKETWSSWRPFATMTKFELKGPEGENAVYAKFSDRDGKESEICSAVIILDTTPPIARLNCSPADAENRVVLSSEVLDAVAMQVTENPDNWGAWEPYTSVKAFTLSIRTGPRIVHARFRDEAGNISEVAQVKVDVGGEPDPKVSGPLIRAVSIAAAAKQPEGYLIYLAIDAAGMEEVELRMDNSEVSPRGPFSSIHKLKAPGAVGSHRIGVRLWDSSKNEYAARVVFQEEELPLGKEAASTHGGQSGDFFTRIRTGLWLEGPGFKAQTTAGPRDLGSGSLGVIEIDLGVIALGPAFLEVFGEYAFGGDAEVASFGLDVGTRFYQGPLIVGNGSLEVRGGPFYSKLDVGKSGFGNFDRDTGWRLGVGGQLEVAERLSLDAGIDFRSVSYKWSGTTVSGDSNAESKGVSLLFGINYRF